MVNVKVIILKGCSTCHSLLTKLDTLDVKYKLIDANAAKNSTFCDELEEVLGINNYPIVITEDNKYVYYYHLVNDVASMITKKISPFAYSCGCYSVDDMVENILN